MGPHLHDYLKQMNKEILYKENIMSVAEGAGKSFEDAHDLVDADRNELNMAYAFDGVDVANNIKGYSLLNLKNVFSRWDSAFANKGWLSIFLANHDNARMVSRFGNDQPVYRELSSKMLSTFLMTMRGTPYYYNGDELGMSNIRFDKIEDYRDRSTLNEYQHQKNIGGDLMQFLDLQKYACRDNGRTPFQWDTTVYAGFSKSMPWIKVNPNYTTVNVASEETDPNSCLNYFRRLVKIRKDNLALVYGQYALVDKDNPFVYAYTRTWEGKKMLILQNFSPHPANAMPAIDLSKNRILLDNYPEIHEPLGKAEVISLRPYEAIIVQIGE